MSVFAGVEAGGTKFTCVIGCGLDDLRAEISFPTTTPDETICQAMTFFKSHREQLRAVGAASFGPLDMDPASPTFGFITTTPKQDWAYTGGPGAYLSYSIRMLTLLLWLKQHGVPLVAWIRLCT